MRLWNFIISLFNIQDNIAYFVKELKDFGTGLVNGADNRSASSRQSFHQRDHLEAGGAVQSTKTKATSKSPNSSSVPHICFINIHTLKTWVMN